MNCSASTDPELADWLRWASESDEVSTFVRTIAEAAFLADLPNYALLRPVLLKSKRRRPHARRSEENVRKIRCAKVSFL
jgi:hypothetical protein